MLLTYSNAVYKPMYLLSSSSVCKLTLIDLLSYLLSKSPLSSQVSLMSLVSLLVTIFLIHMLDAPFSFPSYYTHVLLLIVSKTCVLLLLFISA